MYGKFPFTSGGAVQSAAHHIEVTWLLWKLPSQGDIDVYVFPFSQYSKSSRAKCHGKLCGGSLIGQGELRYGHTVPSSYGEVVQWKHW